MSRLLGFLHRSISSPNSKTSAVNSSPASPDRKYGCKVLYDSENASVDIVFVHGLTGNRMNTWTSEGGICWPRDLLHKAIPEARVIIFGYDADVANFWSPASQNTINDHSQSLVNGVGVLREKDKTNNRPLIFIGHSLGGLVIQNALLVSWSSVEGYRQKVMKSTRAIIFLGTPHCGSVMASWAEFGANILNIVKATNKKILSSLTAGSEVLGGIQDRFHTLLRRLKEEQSINITLICFYEELYVSWIGKKVVPDTSSKLSGYVCEGIHANHMDMTKFHDVEDPGFEKVSNQIWLCLQDISKGPDMNATDRSKISSPLSPIASSGLIVPTSSGGILDGGSNDSRGSNGGVFKVSADSFKNIMAGQGAHVGQ